MITFGHLLAFTTPKDPLRIMSFFCPASKFTYPSLRFGYENTTFWMIIHFEYDIAPDHVLSKPNLTFKNKNTTNLNGDQTLCLRFRTKLYNNTEHLRELLLALTVGPS